MADWSGFSLVELLAVLAVMATVAGFGVSRLYASLSHPTTVETSSKELVGDLRVTRMMAISRDARMQIKVTSTSQYEIQQQNPTTNVWTQIRSAKLGTGMTFAASAPVGTVVAFDARGVMVNPTATITLSVQDAVARKTAAVQVLPSGQILRTGVTAY